MRAGRAASRRWRRRPAKPSIWPRRPRTPAGSRAAVPRSPLRERGGADAHDAGELRGHLLPRLAAVRAGPDFAVAVAEVDPDRVGVVGAQAVAEHRAVVRAVRETGVQ